MSLSKYLLAGMLLLGVPALAAEEQPATLKANLRRLGLELSSTEVKHADAYKDSPARCRDGHLAGDEVYSLK